MNRVAFSVAIVAGAGAMVAEADTWWLIRSGADTWAAGWPVIVEKHSFTAHGSYWWNNSWLAQVLFYLLFRVGGLPAVAGLCMCAFVLAWTLALRVRGPNDLYQASLGLCAIVGSASYVALRPQVLSMLMLALTLSSRTSPHRWLLVPSLMMLWANLHGAFLVGLLVVFVGCLSEAVAERTARPLLLPLASTGACVLTPHGWVVWTETFLSVERSRLNRLAEWLPPRLDENPFFWILAGVLLFEACRRIRVLRGEDWVSVSPALALLPLALTARRNVAFFALAGLVAVSVIRVRGPSAATAPQAPSLRPLTVVSAIVLSALAAIVVWGFRGSSLRWTLMDDATIRAIRSCPDPMYNTYGLGGHLMWFLPERRVFIDSRQDPYPLDLLLMNRRAELSGEFRPLFSKYGIQCAVVPMRSMLAHSLIAESGWTLTHDGRDIGIFVPSREVSAVERGAAPAAR